MFMRLICEQHVGGNQRPDCTISAACSHVHYLKTKTSATLNICSIHHES